MALIFESQNFVVQSEEFPLVDRNDGGHITINAKFKISTRQELSAKQAIELMRLTMVAGEAMTEVLIQHGIDIGRLNYQDNGNWAVFKTGGPQLHYHLYGRAKNAVHQKYGEALHMPHKETNPEFYKMLQPLSRKDVDAMSERIKTLLKNEKYSDVAWGLNFGT